MVENIDKYLTNTILPKDKLFCEYTVQLYCQTYCNDTMEQQQKRSTIIKPYCAMEYCIANMISV